MISIVAAISLTSALSNVQGDRSVWIGLHSSQIRSIDPADTEFSDLEPLAHAIGNARVVQLGEESHGDGATFLAKARLVKFLHEKMGFNVIAFEAGIYSCQLVDAGLQSGLPSNEAAAKGIFDVWSNSRESMPVFDYVRASKSTAQPMTIAGFDFSLTSLESFLSFPKLAQDFFDRTTALTLADKSRWLTISERLQETKVDLVERQRDIDLVGRMISASMGNDTMMASRTSKRERSFMHQQLVNFQKLLSLAFVKPLNDKRKRNYPAINLRDQAMGENIGWLANEYYAGEKIIVWAHSYHVMRNAQELHRLDGSDHSGLFPMGTYVDRIFGKEAYSIAFLSGEGTFGREGEQRSKIANPSPESIDGMLMATGKPFLFIDLRGLPKDNWLRKPQSARPMDYEVNVACWPRIYDAFFYTRTMTSSTPVKAMPQGK